MHIIGLMWRKQEPDWKANSLFALSDAGDDEVDARYYYDSHDNPKYHQPHLHWLLHGRFQGWQDALELQRCVIQLERIVDSTST